MKKIICFIVLFLIALAGCSVAKRPVIDRMAVIELLYAQRREMAAEVEYKRYLREAQENK